MNHLKSKGVFGYIFKVLWIIYYIIYYIWYLYHLKYAWFDNILLLLSSCFRESLVAGLGRLRRPCSATTNERALGECILCKIWLTDWVIYLVHWLWQRWRTQSIGPNDSNEKCAMSRVLFRINIAAIQKISDLDLLHLTLTFSLDLWPWNLTLRPIYYYLDALKKTNRGIFNVWVRFRVEP